MPVGADARPRRVVGHGDATDDGAWLLWCLLIFCGVAVALVAVLGVVAGMVGAFHAVPVLIVSLAGAGVVTIRARADLPGSRRPDLAAVATLILAIGVIGSNAHYAGEHVLVDRDPGVYLTAAVSLSDNGGLRVPTDSAAFGPDASVYFSSGGYSEVDGGEELQPWFLHGIVAVIAVANDLAGPAAAVRVPALLSGLAVLALVLLARRFVGGWPALMGGAMLAACLVQVWAFRDTYSETLGQPLLWGGLALALLARDRCSSLLGLAAGLLLAGATLARLDSPPLLLVAAMLWVLADGARSRQVVRAIALPLGVGLAVWGLQLWVVNAVYFTAHRSETITLAAGSIAASAALVLLGPWVRQLLADQRRRMILGRAAAAAVVVVVVAGLTRPLWGEVRLAAPWPEAQAVEAASGVEATGLRSYAEQTMRWMGWYLGWPGLALATVGAAWAACRAATDRRLGPAALVVASASGPLTLLYLWDPLAVPDHLWVMRRFLVVTIPVLVLAAAVGLDAVRKTVHRLVARRSEALAGGVAVATALLVTVVTLGGEWVTTAPMARLSMMEGNLRLVEQVCASLPDDATVVVAARDGTTDTLSAGVRAFCHTPVGVLRGEDRDGLNRTLASISAVGRNPVVIGADRDLLHVLLPGVRLPAAYLAVSSLHPELNVQKPRHLYSVRTEITVVVIS